MTVKLLAAGIFFLMASGARAQDGELMPRQYYAGYVAEEAVFLMLKEEQPGKFSGYVYTEGEGKGRVLEGTIDDQLAFELVATGEGSGLSELDGWMAEFYEDMSGTWKTKAGMVHEFTFNRVARVEKTEKSFEIGESGMSCRYSAEYPKFDVGSQFSGIIGVADYLNGEIAAVTSSLEGFCAPWVSGEYGDPFASVETALDFDGIRYYSTDVISTQFYVYAYEGGAHGNLQSISVNFDLTDEPDPLDLADCFVTGSEYLQVLSDHCITELEKQEASWVMSGEVTDVKEMLKVFVITPAGIEFTFDPYMVGPYVEGQFVVTAPFDKIGSIIDPEGPLRGFVE